MGDREFHQRVLDSFPNPIMVMNRDLYLVAINTSLENVFNQSAEKALGKPCYEVLFGRTGKCDHCLAHEVFRTGRPQELERSISLPGGKMAYFKVHGHAIYDSEGGDCCFIAHMQDISYCKSLEARLGASQERLRTVMQKAQEGIIVGDRDAPAVEEEPSGRAPRCDVSGPEERLDRLGPEEVIGESKSIQKVCRLIDLVASAESSALIVGESGTGKEFVAQTIHRKSKRSGGPFIVVHCAAYAEMILKSELFGLEKGAFSEIANPSKGRIERAHGGTLLLSEIGVISPGIQVLLLRFLQDHCFERVGGKETLQANVHVLAASSHDLQTEVEAGRFRADLYYQLGMVYIHLPPLRERKEDIPLLARHFLTRSAAREGKQAEGFSPKAMRILQNHPWPGNVRQLENMVHLAVMISQHRIIRDLHLPGSSGETGEEPASLGSLAQNERNLILHVLESSSWNIRATARELKVSRSTLYSKMQRYGIEKPHGMVRYLDKGV